MKKYYAEPDFSTVMFAVSDVILASGIGVEDFTVSNDDSGKNRNWDPSADGWGDIYD